MRPEILVLKKCTDEEVDLRVSFENRTDEEMDFTVAFGMIKNL